MTVFQPTAEQLIASDPTRHVWVSASAGTGKTHVLTDRMLRLMLAGSPPDRILALTFTKAAAAEMQNRLTARLGKWLTLDDTGLDAELAALGIAPSSAQRTRARCLFALALDVPGGLKVQTLHSFAQGLLAAFPLEAGLPPGFRALDERDTRLLRQRALNEAIANAQGAGDALFLEDLAELAVLKGEGGVSQALDRMIAHSEGVLELPEGEGISVAVRRHLNLPPDEKPGEFLAQVLAPEIHDDSRVEAFAAGMERWGAPSGLDCAARARTWLARDAEGRAAHFGDLWKLFIKTDGETQLHKFAVKKSPDLRAIIDETADDLRVLADREARLLTAEFASRALRAGRRVVARYAALKRAAVAIDYDDMIARAARLLGPDGVPGYVGWKLDSRFDHVLVDEAQDTNDRQWAIIARLIEDYFDGEDARRRSLFVVGDLKQAIYGFQGTDPRLFEAQAVKISPAAEAAGRPLARVPLDRSFRSGPAVLDVVNAFLATIGHAALGMTEAAAPHVPHRENAAGEVVLWPVICPAEADEEEGDADNGDTEEGSEAAERLMADRLAKQIANWLDPAHADRLWLPARGRYARPDDILVLLRKRSRLMGALVGQLHRQGVPVAGVDRLLLLEPYAVLDLLALVRFAVQPEDDLNLAGLLVSPFLGWTHEEVRALSGSRRGDLWSALGRAASDGGPADTARGWLNEVLSLADIGGPYGFLDTILSGPLDGRRRLLARLGTEANDAIDELLLQALAYEAQHPPALAGFLAWIESEGSSVVKRDAEAPAAQVRLMTVHGAKGLEAPVVVLADTAHNARESRDGYIPVRLDGALADVPLFHPPVKQLPAILRERRDAQLGLEAEEDLRLLYVAITRAADHLYIGGALGQREVSLREKNPKRDRSWHTQLKQLFAGLPDVAQIETDWGTTHRLRRGDWNVARTETATIAPQPGKLALDEVLTTPAPPPGRPMRPLTPSALPDDPAAAPPPADLRARAKRGELLHKLFERLPAVSPERRDAVATAWLHAQGVEPGTIPALVREALAVIEAPEHAALFGPDSLAEAPVAGLVEGRTIAGIIDRLLVTPTEVLVVDFKTGLSVPPDAEAVPMPYKRQMAAYRAVLARAFPDRPVTAALLFTAGPKMIFLDPKQLDALAHLD